MKCWVEGGSGVGRGRESKVAWEEVQLGIWWVSWSGWDGVAWSRLK
jgi:hypothetical protein